MTLFLLRIFYEKTSNKIFTEMFFQTQKEDLGELTEVFFLNLFTIL